MGRPWAPGLVLAAAVLCATLAGCAPRSSTVIPSVDSTPILATLSVQSTSSPVATVQSISPSPTPTAIPAPTATPQPWTPGPLATPDKITHDGAVGSSIYDDYFVVQQNGLQGLVGADGHVILPCSFASVEAVGHHYTDFFAGEHAFAPMEKPLFFVVPPQVGPKEYDRKRAQGLIYNANGKPISKELFLHAYYIGTGIIRAEQLNGEGDSASVTDVVLNDAGRVLVRGAYESVVMVGDRMYAGLQDLAQTDVFTAQGKKLRTLPVAMRPGYTVAVGNGKYLGMMDFAGASGVTLLDRDFRAMFTVESILDWLAEDRFLVSQGGGVGVVDAAGAPVVPLSYDEVTLIRDGGKDYLCAQGRGGCALYGLDGKLLYQSQDYTQLSLTDGRLIALSGDGDESVGRVLGPDGHDLLGRNDVREWLPDARLYRCQDSGNNTFFIREDGSELPLPKAPYIECLGADRFLVMLSGGKTGLYDSMGKVIIPAAGDLQQGGLPGVLVSTVADHGHTVQWLVDDNGNRLWSQPMDSIEYTWKKDVFQVHLRAKYGLMRLDGSWIWSASDYQELQD